MQLYENRRKTELEKPPSQCATIFPQPSWAEPEDNLWHWSMVNRFTAAETSTSLWSAHIAALKPYCCGSSEAENRPSGAIEKGSSKGAICERVTQGDRSTKQFSAIHGIDPSSKAISTKQSL